MLSSFHPRVRIAIVLVSSFFISGIIMKYSSGTAAETVGFAPAIHIDAIANDLSKSAGETKESILASVQSFHMPALFTYTPPSTGQAVPTEEPTPTESVETPFVPEIPTSTPAMLLPTDAPITVPTDIPVLPSSIPSTAPSVKPTEKPKPTKPPKPTPTPELPPINDDVRPGTSIEEIMKDVEKRACVPYKLLMAIRTQESGVWFKNMSAATTKMYNTYGWWKTADKGTICSGLGYHTQTGIIPPDSASPGERCNNAVGSPNDIGVMGIMQVSQQEQDATRKYTTKTLPKSIDRRVLFDNILIFAIATKNRAGKNPQPSCSDWPEETVKEVARIHASGSGGSCKYYYPGRSGDYCKEIWDLYRSFK